MTWHVCTVVCSQFNSTTGFTFTVPRADTAKIAFKSGPPKTVEEVEFASNTVMLSTFSGSTECVKYCSSAICLKRAPFTSIMNGDYGSLMTLQSSCQFDFFFSFSSFDETRFHKMVFLFVFIFGPPKSADDSLIKILMIQNEIVSSLLSPKLFQTQSTEERTSNWQHCPLT